MTIHKKGASRRVSFKPPNAQGGGKQIVKLRAAQLGIRSAFDEEDDERMIEFSGSKGSTFRRRNSPIPGSTRNKARGLVENASGWFQVTVSQSTYSTCFMQFGAIHQLRLYFRCRFHTVISTKKIS